MKFIFDFDRTLYDTDKQNVALENISDEGARYSPQVWEKLEPKDFLYPDTVSFLRELNSKDVIILTAWSDRLGLEAFQFQKVKVERSGVMEFVNELIVMEGEKGPFVKDLCDSEPTIFVDDSIAHLLSAKQHCPEVKVVQMVREGVGILPGHPSVPVVSTLPEIFAALTHE